MFIWPDSCVYLRERTIQSAVSRWNSPFSHKILCFSHSRLKTKNLNKKTENSASRQSWKFSVLSWNSLFFLYTTQNGEFQQKTENNNVTSLSSIHCSAPSAWPFKGNMIVFFYNSGGSWWLFVQELYIKSNGRLWKDTYVFEPSFSDIYFTFLLFYFSVILHGNFASFLLPMKWGYCQVPPAETNNRLLCNSILYTVLARTIISFRQN